MQIDLEKWSAFGGNFDSSKGDFRLCGVTAGIGGKTLESQCLIFTS